MMYLLKSVLVVFLLSCIWLFRRHGIVSVNDGGGDIAINCGSAGKSTALDGREWMGESASKFISGRSTSSIVVDNSFLGVDSVPYLTSRVSAAPFHFTFKVNPGQNFIRFHFYPTSYRGFENSRALFSVKAGPFTLLNDFSPAITSVRLGVKYVVKEFCINVEEHGKLNITFPPSKNHLSYAFVNGIEIISMPTGLYYTPDGDLGAQIVGQNYRFYSIDNKTALEMVQRLNIGGYFISSVEDIGMFRQWTTDAAYFLERARVSRVNYMCLKLACASVPLLVAPPKIYQTSWKTATTTSIDEHRLYSFTWKIPINLGFTYLVRLHFCDLDAAIPDSEQKEFSILINDQIAETQAGVRRWSSDIGYPLYKDYVVMMRGDKEARECHLFIVIRSVNGLALGLLKGIEIFKLSNLANSLATPGPASFIELSTTRNHRFSSRFSKSHVMGTFMTITVIIVTTTVYSLGNFSQQNVHYEPSCQCFSLADIKLATQDFSDEFVIGNGGFGKVYKGIIYGVPDIVAIKRLSFFSRQGVREFWTEIKTLSKLRHIHLVSLIGYCNEDQEMILVYKFVSSGTLADNLYKFSRKGKARAPLSWEQRLRICIGTARGLDYLHTGGENGIIHRDVKPSNILLDENFIPKISDFGLSKLEKFTKSKSYVKTKVKGTNGYLDPNYRTTRRLTIKSDVYSFGMVLLVVLSGRPALDNTNPGERESLLTLFQECLLKGEFDQIVDPYLSKKLSPESLLQFLKSVGNCLQQQPENRPTMAQLVGCLEQILQLQGKPIISASGDAVQHFESGKMIQGSVSTTLEESVVSPPREEITSRKAMPRDKVNNRIRKPFWGWPWKILFQSRGDESGPCLDGIPVDKFVQFSYKELAKASRDSSLADVIFESGRSTVYNSELRGERVAIRKFDLKRSGEFLAEFRILAHVHHRNLVRLIGYCVEGPLFLVFEYVDNGNLKLHLHGSGESLSWLTRVQIALDSARALEYIHEYTVPAYIHCDITPSSILIDTSFRAKVADFGLSKVTEINGGSFVSSHVVGTMGYVAPECAMQGKVSSTVDVYAFGIVLYELISAKKAVEWETDSTGQRKLLVQKFEEVLSLAGDHIRNDELRKLVDSRLGDYYLFDSVLKMAQLGRACTQENHRLRPPMSSVVAELIALSSVSTSQSLNEMEMLDSALMVGREKQLRAPTSVPAECDVDWLKRKLWGITLPPEIRLFIWEAVNGALPTSKAPNAKSMEVSCCCRCGDREEDIDHLFMKCVHSKWIWRLSAFGFNFDVGTPVPFRDWLLQWFQTAPDDAAIVHTCCIIWQIWLSRNIQYLERKQRDPILAVKEATRDAQKLLAQGDSIKEQKIKKGK